MHIKLNLCKLGSYCILYSCTVCMKTQCKIVRCNIDILVSNAEKIGTHYKGVGSAHKFVKLRSLSLIYRLKNTLAKTTM